MHDIKGYMVIIMILLTGFSVSFAVSMPDNEEFDDGLSGPLVGLVTSFQAMLGAFEMTDYTNKESTAFFLFFLFLVVLVMLNLLIAIMGDQHESATEVEPGNWLLQLPRPARQSLAFDRTPTPMPRPAALSSDALNVAAIPMFCGFPTIIPWLHSRPKS